MANWNRLAVAAGLAGALAVFGTAWAQSPGASNNTAGSGQSATPGQTGDKAATQEQGARTGWSGHKATEPGQTTAGSQGSSDTATPTTQDTASTSDTAAGTSAKSSGKVDKKLEEEIQKIHAANEAEVHMGQMGAQQATSPEVKEFAEKLEQDHKRLDEKLTQTAQSAGIQLEGKGYQSQQKDAQKNMKKLTGKTGQDFDKEFVSMMVKDHEKDIKTTEKAAKEAKKQNQTELASLLEQAVTGMKGHLQTAKQLKDTVGKGKSARGTTSGSTGAGSTGGSSSMGSGSTGGSSSTGSSSGSTSHDKGTTGDTTTNKKPGSGQ
jgi:putative membrane protein